jgi:hypothetical protein
MEAMPRVLPSYAEPNREQLRRRAAPFLAVEPSEPKSRRYIAILAAVSAVILIGGWWMRPKEVPLAPAAVPSETELEQLAH